MVGRTDPVPGSRVVGAGGKKIGKVLELVQDPDSGQLIGVTVSYGLLRRKKKQVSMKLIKHVTDQSVALTVSRAQFQQLPDAPATKTDDAVVLQPS